MPGVATSFVGYETMQAPSEILRIIKADQFVPTARQGEEVEVITAQTPFYGEAGGQVGDHGVIEGKGFLMEVHDTIRPVPQLIVHKGVIKKGEIKMGDKITLQVDGERRRATARNHTATHLLQAALREVVGGHINQAGSAVSPERLRFDFTHYEAIDPDALERIEALVNQWIWEDQPVAVEVMATEEAIERGATALFGERYGEEARVISVGDYSQELCGGSHVTRTGEIGIFTLVSESGVAAGVRRIEALTGRGAFDHLRSMEHELKEVAQLIKARPGEVAAKVERLLSGQRGLEREIETLRRRIATSQTGSGPEVKEVEGIKVVAFRADDMDPKGLRDIGDGIKAKIGSGIIVVGGEKQGKGTIVAMVTRDLAERFGADELIKGLTEIGGGRGGGNPTMAQAGGVQAEKIDDCLDAVYGMVKNRKS